MQIAFNVSMAFKNIKFYFFLFRFHNDTGNYWKYRDQFIKIPGNYNLFSNDLDLSVRKEVSLIFPHKFNLVKE
jgi:hypothetical protein